MIAKGFTIGLICLVLGGVIGFKVKYLEVQTEAKGIMQGIEMGKKSK
ncbi:hypothetical protein [Pseudanabaena yagii]|uniref:Uncharacterized protein n=1 Tax=Pseudanabaena yagii GIHE-NHR1 TaxID=2722753 RepID=A0ABX1LQJ1_9CYAN|nr:hypothetical protein [Pseudanabaena yagii]NMF57099.1 hypothetical protein [Pseudanabaena yagii GIHE-NHR1]